MSGHQTLLTFNNRHIGVDWISGLGVLCGGLANYGNTFFDTAHAYILDPITGLTAIPASKGSILNMIDQGKTLSVANFLGEDRLSCTFTGFT